MKPVIEGQIDGGYDQVADAFAAAFEGRPTMGAALAIRVGGERVVHLWGGTADETDGKQWTKDTASVIFSCTKGLMSILLARLVQEGRLDYDALVTRYWPEFGAAGKDKVTVRQLISHKAGLSAPQQDWTLVDMLDWNAATRLLAEQAPLWPPGSGYAYHALTHGWLTGELVRRIAQKSPGDYFAELVTGPLGASAWIGLPQDHEGSIAHLQVAPDLAALWQAEAARHTGERPNWGYRAMTLGEALPPSLVTKTGGFNDPRIRQAEIPGAGGIATADALATIWSATVCETQGAKLLQSAIVQQATQTETSGPPVFDPQPPYSRWGMGFQLDSDSRRYLTAASFGHDGAGGQVGFADPSHGVGFAFITNWMEAAEDFRATRIIDALRAALQ
ncbi:MAG: serine hydrolase domain-containing protein [Devosia sp.]